MNSAYPTSQRELKHCLSPGLPYLRANTMCDSLQLWKLHIWSSWKGRDIHSSIFPHNQSFTKEEKESADAGELSSWISGRVFFFFFILLSTACLILIKPILHSCLFVFHWIGWRYLLHSLTLRNKLRVFNSSQISRVMPSTLGKSLLFLIRRRNKWKICNKKGRHTNCLCFFHWKPLCKAHQPQRFWCWGARLDSEAD